MRHFEDKVGTFGRLGNFWSERTTLSTRADARHMSHAPLLTGSNFSLDQSALGLEGGGWAFASDIDLTWDPFNVAIIGPDLQERIITEFATELGVKMFIIRRPLEGSLAGSGDVLVLFPYQGVENYVLRSSDCNYILLPVSGATPEAVPVEDLRVKWIVPIPQNIRPTVIAVGSRFLVLGIDFVLQQGALIFREDPFKLFSSQGKIHVVSAWKQQSFLLDYTLQVDHPAPSQQKVAYFYRSVQTAHSLRDALAEVAGRLVMSDGFEVAEVQQWCDAMIYISKDGRRLEIPYHHTPYQVGDFIAAGAILGGGIRVGGGRQDQPHWYREFNFGEGLPSSVVSPFPDLLIPDQPVRFEAYEDTGSKLHVRPHLPGDDAVRENYWHWIKQAELASGYYLNDILNIGDVGDSVYVNGLDFYFENGLNMFALIVELDEQVLGPGLVTALTQFVMREKLHNTVPIILTV